MTTIQFRILEDGRICCSTHTPNGQQVAPLYPCDRCKAHFAAIGLRADIEHKKESETMPSFAPDPYAPDRAVLMTAEQKHAAKLKAASFAAIEVAAAAASAENARLFRAMRQNDAGLANFAAPDGYSIALKASKR